MKGVFWSCSWQQQEKRSKIECTSLLNKAQITLAGLNNGASELDQKTLARDGTQSCPAPQLTLTASKIGKDKAMWKINLHKLDNTNRLRTKLADCYQSHCQESVLTSFLMMHFWDVLPNSSLNNDFLASCEYSKIITGQIRQISKEDVWYFWAETWGFLVVRQS